MNRRGFVAALIGASAAKGVRAETPVRLAEVPLMQCICRYQMEMLAGDEWPHAIRATCHSCNVTVLVPLKTR